MKLKQTLFALLLALCTAVALTSCLNLGGGAETPEECEHVFGEAYAVIDATCSKEGLERKNCIKDGCDYYETAPIKVNPAAHKLTGSGSAQAPTCYSVGWKEYMICSECGYNNYVEIPILPHTYVDGVCSVCDFNQDHATLVFTLSEDGTYYILSEADSYVGSSLTVPATYRKLPVKAIGQYAFATNTALECVSLPATVSDIESGAFYGCTSLGRVVFMDSTTDAEGKETAVTPAIRNLGESVFEGCTSLTVVSVGSEAATASGVVIPSGVTAIGGGAFKGCTSLSDITLPEISAMGASFFEGCTALASVEVPASVSAIGEAAFRNCTLLTDVSFPAKVEGNATTPSALAAVGKSAFVGCDSLVSIAFPDALVSIGESAFEGCAALETVTLSSSCALSSVGSYAFKDCSALSTFNFTVGLSSIGMHSFEGTALTSVYVPNEVQSVGIGAFAGCESLASIVIPFVGQSADGSGATHFGYVFGATAAKEQGASIPASLASVYVNVTNNIAAGAFAGCSNINEISVSDKITSVGAGAFDGVSDSVFTVEGELCYVGNGDNPYLALVKPVNSSIISCEINYNTVVISDGAFKNCAKLETVTFAEKTETVTPPAAASESTDSSEPVTVVHPASVRYIGAEAFRGCTNLYRFTLTENLSTIGDSAFEGCRKLVEVYNKSHLTVSLGAEDNGAVALNAKYVYAPEYKDGVLVGAGESRISVSAGFICYEDESGELALVGYNGKSAAVVVPKGVSYVLPYALSNSSVLSVAFEAPAEVKAIGYAAFEGCEALVAIEAPFVGDGGDNTHFGYVFGAETYEENAECVPATLKYVSVCGGAVADYAFYGCVGLASVSFVNASDAVTVNVVETVNDEVTTAVTTTETVTYGTSDLTAIGAYAFYGCESLAAVTVPGRVVSVDEFAFAGCTSLKTVAFGNVYSSKNVTVTEKVGEAEPVLKSSVTTVLEDTASALEYLGVSAFEGCTALVAVTVPGGVATVPDNAFKGCTALSSVAFCEKVVVSEVTETTETELEAEKDSTDKKYEIVTDVDVTTVTVSGGVEVIGASAFEGCTALAALVIPGSVTDVSASAFYGCEALASLSFADKVVKTSVVTNRTTVIKTVGEEETKYSDPTEQAIPHEAIEDKVSAPALVKIHESAFAGCTALSSVTVPAGVTELGASAFEGAGLKSVDFADDAVLTEIGTAAFKNCDKLVSFDIPEGILLIKESAFEDCDNLLRVYVSKTVEEIRAEAFAGCNKLTIVVVDEKCGLKLFTGDSSHGKIALNATKILYDDLAVDTDELGFVIINDNGIDILYAYTGTDTDIRIPAQVVEIFPSAFENASITSVVIPATVSKIGLGAFIGCEALESITVAYVGDGAGNNNFGYIFGAPTYRENGDYVPASLTNVNVEGGYVADYAFAGCNGIERVAMSSAVESVGKSAFRNLDRLQSVTVSGPVGEDAFYGCEHLNHVTLLSTVNTIGNNAFRDCYRLVEVHNASTLNVVAGEDEANGCVGRYALDIVNYSDSTPTTNVYVDNDGYVIYKTGDELVLVDYVGDSADIVVPEGVTAINDYALYTYGAAESITVPVSVKKIGVNAFYGCNSVKSVSVPFVGNGNNITHFGYIFGAADKADNGYFVPATLESITVTASEAISAGAFTGCDTIVSVTFADSIKKIGAEAFVGCTALSSVTFGNSVEVIDSSAFEGCSALKSLTLYDSLKVISTRAFADCTALTSVSFATPKATLTIESEAFKGCSALQSLTLPAGVDKIDTAAFANTGIKTLTIDNISAIGNSAFAGCTALETLTVTNPENLKKIGDSAFEGCAALTAIPALTNIETVGNSAFAGCASITEVVIGDNVKQIGTSAFAGCASVTKLTAPTVGIAGYEFIGYFFGASDANRNVGTVPASLTEVTITRDSKVGDRAFYGCSGIKTVKFSENLTSIGEYAFADCAAFEGVTLTTALTSIGNYAFKGCSSIKSVSIPDTVVTLGESSFEGCTALNSVSIGGGVKIIQRATFRGCSSLTAVTVPAQVVYVNVNSFADCTALSDISFAGNVRRILAGAFANTALTSFTVPATVTELGLGVFAGCEALESITLPYLGNKLDAADSGFIGYVFGAASAANNAECVPASLKSVTVVGGEIKDYAFFGCSSISEINIPESVSSIGTSAFENCNSLTSVVIPQAVTAIGSRAFAGTAITSVTVPAGVTAIEDATFYGCDKLTSVAFAEGCALASVGTDAFGGCVALSEMTLPATVTSVGAGLGSCPDGLFTVINGGYYLGTEDNAYHTLIKVVADSDDFAIGAGAVVVAEGAFTDCTGIITLTVPESVAYVCDGAFVNCARLVEICNKSNLAITAGSADFGGIAANALRVYSEGDSAVTTTDGFKVFTDGNNKLLVSYVGEAENVVIPADVTAISAYAFDGCAVKSIVIGEAVSEIAYGALAGCDTVESISFASVLGSVSDYFGGEAPASLTTVTVTGETIAAGAFAGCDGIKTVKVEHRFAEIGFGAFKGCNALEKLVIPYLFTSESFGYLFGATTAAENAEYVPATLSEVEIDWWYEIPDYAFYGCPIKSLTIKELSNIGFGAFEGCSSLEYLELHSFGIDYGTDETVGFFGYYFGATDAKTGYLKVPTSLKTVVASETADAPDYYFYNCSSIEKIVLSYADIIGVSAFEGCSSLSNVEFTDGNIHSIGDRAFAGTAITKISIPNSVSEIGDGAFEGCSELVAVSFDDDSRLKTIGDSAFAGTALSAIEIPVGVTSLGNSAFEGCSALTSVAFAEKTVGEGEAATKQTSKLQSIGDSAFAGTAITEIAIPAGVTQIGASAFEGCAALKTVVFKAYDVLKMIGNAAFKDTAIEEIAVPVTVTYVGDSAFENCCALSKITFTATVGEGEEATVIESNLGYLGAYAFAGTAITEIAIPAGVDAIYEGTFKNCASIKSVTLANNNSVTEIKDEAFYGCIALESVAYGESSKLQSIGKSAFEGCNSLTTLAAAATAETACIVIPETVSTIGEFAFMGCSSAKVVNLPASVSELGEAVFKGCSAMVSVDIAEDSKLQIIGKEAFYNCSALEGFDIPAGVTEIGESAFEGCKLITKIKVPAGITEIKDSTFAGCSKVSEITFAEGCAITRIGEAAFAGCAAVKTLAVPATVTEIGFGAFEGFYALESLTVPFVGGGDVALTDEQEKLPETTHIGYVFGAVSSADNSATVPTTLKSVTVLSGDEISARAFADCAYLVSVVLPDTVTKIGEGAFAGCASLKSFTAPASCTEIGFGALAGCESLVSVTVPFVGGGDVTLNDEQEKLPAEELAETTHIGYVFGAATHEDNGAFVPATIRKITVTGSGAIAEGAFFGCAYVAIVEYPEGTEVAEGAFEGCDRLAAGEDKVVSLDENGYLTETVGDTVTLVEYVGNAAELVIPEGVTNIGQYVFANMSGIKSVTLSATVKVIESAAFEGMADLTDVSLTAEIESIASDAFAGCDSLKYKTDSAGGFYLGYSNNEYFALVKTEVAEGEYAVNVLTALIADGAFEGSGAESIVLPTSVTVVGKDAFKNAKSLEKISISDSISYIGTGAFDGCDALKYTVADKDNVYYLGNSKNPNLVLVKVDDTSKMTYVINENTKFIASGAFAGCTNLATIVVPKNVAIISDGAFEDCTSLVEIHNNSGLAITAGDEAHGGIAYYAELVYTTETETKVTVSDDGLVFLNKTTLVGYIGEAEEVVIPQGTTAIHPYAFIGTGIKSVTIAQSVTEIGNCAFKDCASLGEVVFADYKLVVGEGENQTATILTTAVDSIGEYAFAGTALTSFVVPEGVSALGAYAFADCSALESVYVTEDSTLAAIGEGAFAGCTALSVFDVYAEERDEAEKFVGLAIPEGITEIGANAFSGCASVTALKLSSTVATVGEGAFEYCSSITELEIPKNVTEIGLGAFAGCDGLESVTVPFVGDGAENTHFGYIFGAETYEDNGAYTPAWLTSVTVSGAIADCAFYGCSGITEITVAKDSGLTAIGASAFEGCTSLAGFTAPKSVTAIGFGAFAGCESLESLTAPIVDAEGAATYIGYLFGAAGYNKNGTATPAALKSVTVLGNANIAEYAFYGCKTVESVVFDEDAAPAEIGEAAFYNCYALASIVIPESVQYIGIRAFYGCDSLTSMTVPFVGDGRENTHFGYIFGATTYESNVGYVPVALETVILTGDRNISRGAFYGCANIKSVVFDENAEPTVIGNYAFEGCVSLESINLPISLSTIGMAAFKDCVSLTTVSISEISQLKSIGNEAFFGCVSLTEFRITKFVEYIGRGAFAGCEALESVSFKNTTGWTAGGKSVNFEDAALAAQALKELYAETTIVR